MPELPEVETVARQLAPLLSGRRIRAVSLLDPRLDPACAIALPGKTVVSVTRVGKRVVLDLAARPGDSATRWLCIHLRMTGRLIWQPGRSTPGVLDTPHLRALFHLSGGGLLFIDPRRFGTIEQLTTPPQDAQRALEPLGPAFSAQWLAQQLAASRQPLKLWLLRQDKLVGVGNIYASEILHAAGIHPQTCGAALDQAAVQRLHRATRRILRLAIRYCGTTFSDFQDAHGVTGSFQKLLRVYGRDGAPCRSCGKPVERLLQGQRSTFYCPQCQPPAADGKL